MYECECCIVRLNRLVLTVELSAGIFKRLRCPRIESASLCSLAGRHDNTIPTRFLAPIDCSKIPAQHNAVMCTLHISYKKTHKNYDWNKTVNIEFLLSFVVVISTNFSLQRKSYQNVILSWYCPFQAQHAFGLAYVMDIKKISEVEEKSLHSNPEAWAWIFKFLRTSGFDSKNQWDGIESTESIPCKKSIPM